MLAYFACVSGAEGRTGVRFYFWMEYALGLMTRCCISTKAEHWQGRSPAGYHLQVRTSQASCPLRCIELSKAHVAF